MLQQFMIEEPDDEHAKNGMFYGLRSQNAVDIEIIDNGHDKLLAKIDHTVSETLLAMIQKEVSLDNEWQALLKWFRGDWNVRNIPIPKT